MSVAIAPKVAPVVSDVTIVTTDVAPVLTEFPAGGTVVAVFAQLASVGATLPAIMAQVAPVAADVSVGSALRRRDFWSAARHEDTAEEGDDNGWDDGFQVDIHGGDLLVVMLGWLVVHMDKERQTDEKIKGVTEVTRRAPEGRPRRFVG